MRTAFAVAVCFTGAPSAQDPILARLSAETTNVLVVRDPLPLLEQVLDSPITQQLLDGTAQLQRTSFGRVFTPAALKQQLALVRAMIPTEVVIAAPTRTIDRLSHVAPLYACYEMLQVIGRAGPTDGALTAQIQATAKRCIEQFDNLPLQAWVRVRDERTAEQWFDSLAETLRDNARVAGLDVKVDGERIEVRAEPFAAGAPLVWRLDGGGIDASAAPVLEVSATIELRGAELELRVGKLASPPCLAGRLGPVWQRATAPPFFARVETGEGAPSFADVYSHLAALANLDLAASDGLHIASLYDLLSHADGLGADQSWVLDVDRGFVWTHEVHGSGNASSDEAVPADLLRLASAGEGPLFVTSDTLDVVLSGWLQTIAGRVLPERAPGKPLADFLDDESSARFAPGVLVIARPAGMRGMKGGPGPLPFAAVALVAKPKSGADGATFLREMTKHVATMVGGSTDVWRAEDLGLGVPAHALRLDVVAPLLQQREIDWDFAPHWFVTAELLVLSTDPDLSKALLARAADPGDAPERGPRLLQRLHLRGHEVADFAAAMKLWAPVVAELQQRPQDDRVRLFEAMQAAGGAVDFVETRAEVDGNVLRKVTTLRLRQPK